MNNRDFLLVTFLAIAVVVGTGVVLDRLHLGEPHSPSRPLPVEVGK